MKVDFQFDEKSVQMVERQLEGLSIAVRLKYSKKAAAAGAKVFVKALKTAYRGLSIKKSGARELARTVRQRVTPRRRGKGGAYNILVGNARGEGYFWNWVERGTSPHSTGKGKGGQHPGMRAYHPIRTTIEKTGDDVGEAIAAELQRQIRQSR